MRPRPGQGCAPSKRRPTLGRPPLGLHRVPMPKRWYPRSGIQRLGSCVSLGEHWGRGALRESPGRPPSAAGRGRERVVSPTPHKAKGLACSKHPRSSRYRISPLSLYHELFLALPSIPGSSPGDGITRRAVCSLEDYLFACKS